MAEMPTTIAGYEFKDLELLKLALTHRSHKSGISYERLEFLGDRVLNLCVAELIFKNYEEDSEGRLSKRHAALVREETLAEIALEWGLDKHVKMAAGEARSGGRQKPSILGDVVESILAAMFLDSSGLEKPKETVTKYWEKRMDTAALLDAKSQLQEYLQGQKNELPTYKVVAEEGKDHVRKFTVEVLSALGNAEGEGLSKQAAGQKAAENLLVKLGER